MNIKIVPAGIYSANCYILTDEISKEIVILDPGGDSKELINVISSIDGNVKMILLTHGHLDHTGGVQDLVNVYNCPVYLNKKDEDMLSEEEPLFPYFIGNKKVDGYLKDGDEFFIGQNKIICLETPGHTPGGMSFLVGDMVFTGDTLFEGSIGRTDFKGGDFETLLKSIKEKLSILPDDTVVYPGHGGKSTIGNEKKFNPFL